MTHALKCQAGFGIGKYDRQVRRLFPPNVLAASDMILVNNDLVSWQQ